MHGRGQGRGETAWALLIRLVLIPVLRCCPCPPGQRRGQCRHGRPRAPAVTAQAYALASQAYAARAYAARPQACSPRPGARPGARCQGRRCCSSGQEEA